MKRITNSSPQKLFVIFLAVWVAINILQAIFTEITDDEAYYAALYGAHPAWGYFDHPPMVAFITGLGSLLCSGNLSVRLFTILFQLFTIVLLWKTANHHAHTANRGNTGLFFIIAGSMIMFTAYGFITGPDAPLLFFATLFLCTYQRFLERQTWSSTLLLAISMAGMIYSKYHGIIIIGLVLLSNFKLLKSSRAWIAVAGTLLLLVPHIGWQAAMDWPTFKYHLIGRSFGFHWNEFLGHIPNQLIIFNPLTIGLVAFIVVKYRPRDLFERALYFQIIGFQLFFFAMTFKGYVQPHWTAPATLAMIITVYRHSIENPKILRFVHKWVAPTILLILAARILLVTNLLPERIRFHGKEKANRAIAHVAGELPVVFTGSFQRPSSYQYFTGNEAILLSAVNSRLTQFDILQKELQYHGKPVFVRADHPNLSHQYTVNGFSFTGFVAQSFQSVNRLKVDYSLEVDTVTPGSTIAINFTINNPCSFDVDFNHPEFPVRVCAFYAIKRKTFFAESQLNQPVDIIRAGQTVSRRLQTTVPALEAGKYQFTLTLDNLLCAAVNSFYTHLVIKPNDR